MPQSQTTQGLYSAVETVLSACMTDTCRLFHANAPLQLIDSIQRQTAQICVWSIASDKIRINSSGITPVHDVTIEVNLIGTLETIDAIALNIINTTTGEEIEAEEWALNIDLKAKRDFWEGQTGAKRIWLQLTGLAIAPEPGTDGLSESVSADTQP